MDQVLNCLEQDNVMVMLYTYGKVEGEAGQIDAPKSSRMVFRMKDTENAELLNLFVDTALKVSKKEKSHLCYTVAHAGADTLVQVLQENGFEKTAVGTESEGILYTKPITLTKDEMAQTPIPFDGIDCFMLWGTQGVSYKIGKGTNVTIKAFDKSEFLD